ncbi:Hypothetical predicted protein [Pelobates cultripes]|uniref:Sushi domain-containing protein n=1 Tax=Pelobates cultripes TaxID=61616 RepID=A0AAD1SB29_PELCU|nr:Hypothetical predicted protein [Pelobates cultripes]
MRTIMASRDGLIGVRPTVSGVSRVQGSTNWYVHRGGYLDCGRMADALVSIMSGSEVYKGLSQSKVGKYLRVHGIRSVRGVAVGSAVSYQQCRADVVEAELWTVDPHLSFNMLLQDYTAALSMEAYSCFGASTVIRLRVEMVLYFVVKMDTGWEVTLFAEMTNCVILCIGEVDCGMPSVIEHANMIWNNQTTLGNSAYYMCKPGFMQNGENNMSLCTAEAVWEELNMTCTVKEGLINNISIFNNTCIQWKKSIEILDWIILYKFSIFGTRWLQKDFVAVSTFNYTTDKTTLNVCLELLPETNYTVTITALSVDLPVTQMNLTLQTAMKGRFGNIVVFNGTCMQWTRSSNEEALLDIYTVFIHGRMWSLGYKLPNIIFNFSTNKKTPVLCLDLPPAAEYLINVTESSTDISNHVHLNISEDEHGNTTGSTLLNKVCLHWNKGMDDLQEVMKMDLREIRWYPVKLVPELFFNISTLENTSACLDLPAYTQPKVEMTETPHHQNNQSTAIYEERYFSNLTLLNETCLCWKRQSRIKEKYMIVIYGVRWYETNFIHKVIFNVTTKEEIPVLCLKLEPGTNYTVTLIPFLDQQHSAHINIMTNITDPPLPKQIFVAEHGPTPRLGFERVEHKYGPISSYQVFVINMVTVCSFTCESLEPVTYFSNKSKALGYITAEFFPHDISEHLEFSVGDRKYYGDFYNAPLARGKDYCIILRIISKLNKVRTQSCMVLTEIRDLHPIRHHVTVALLVSVVLIFIAIGFTFFMAWYCRR